MQRQRLIGRRKTIVTDISLEIVYKAKLFKLAIYSRLLVLFLGFVSNIFIPDHHADVFVAPTDPHSTNSTAYIVTNYLFGGFIRWDAQHFQHIARNGYTYENSLAFFPLFPMICRGISLAINYICVTNLDAVITLTFIFFNNLLFLWAVRVLYDLTKFTFDDRFAFITGCMFIINPATTFFVAPYTETLYAYLTFKTLHHSIYVKNAYNCTLAIFYLTLTVLTRSNGLLNIGYLIFFAIQDAVNAFLVKNKYNDNFMVKYKADPNYMDIITIIKSIDFALVKFCAICISVPILFFMGVQYYHYYNFCTDFSNNLPNYVSLNGHLHFFIMPGLHSKYNQTWCNQIIPISYGYIQGKYWGVGFMRYYAFKQIPNFLLAFPVIFIMLWNLIPYIIKNSRNMLSSRIIQAIKDAEYKGVKCMSDIIGVCTIHGTFLTIFCIFCIHIQVSTRMLLSANPIFYWICASYFKDFRIEDQKISLIWQSTTKAQRLLLIYFFSYIIIGTIMFCNNLPWT